MFLLHSCDIALLGGARAGGARIGAYDYGLGKGAIACASGLCIAVSRAGRTVELAEGGDAVGDGSFVDDVLAAGSFFGLDETG